MVVAGQHQHPAVPGRARQAAVLERIAGPVDARPLAVPDGEHAVVFRGLADPQLLGAPAGGRRHILVDARLEGDLVRIQVLLGLPQGRVVSAEGRAPISGDEPGRIQTRGLVPAMLNQRQSNQRLHAGHVNAAAVGGVFVFEAK